MLVVTNIILLRQKFFSRQAYFCRDERRVFVGLCFVATKMILVAAPAADSNHGVDLRKILQTLAGVGIALLFCCCSHTR